MLSETQQTQDSGLTLSSIISETENKKTLIKTEQNSSITTTPRNLAFAGMAVGGSLLFIMFATQIITGIAAAVLTAVAGIGGWYGVKTIKAMDPVIKQKLRNKRLKMMYEEARKNAVEQLDNLRLIKKDRLDHAIQSLNQMGGYVRSLKDQINPENKGKPNYIKKVEMLATVEKAYEQMKDSLKKGTTAYKQYCEKVSEYKEMDKFASIAGKAMDFFNSSSGKEMEEMLSLEAFGAIEDNFNTAIVSIENSSMNYELNGGF